MFYDFTRWGEAAVMCRGCPILEQCRQDHIGDAYAYAGGMTPNKRAAWAATERDRKVRLYAAPKGPRTPTSGPKAKVSAEKTGEILAIWDAELIGTKTLAERVNLAKSTVQRILIAHDRRRSPEERAELARRGGLLGGQEVIREQNNAMVRKLLDENYSRKEIAEIVGVTQSTVSVIIRRIGA
jgi:transposase